MLSFVLLVCSASPSSLPTRPGFTCASQDNMCWKEQVLWYNKAFTIASELVVLERDKGATLEASNAILRKGFDDATKFAERMAERAQKSGERSVADSPFLWSAITGVVVASMAIGIAQGFKVSLSGR